MTPLRILFADDLAAFRMAASEWLEADGHVIEVAQNGRDAAKLLSGKHFDLLITDIIMPDGDGIELIRNVRKTHPELKIVAISAGSEHLGPDFYISMAKRFGADGVMLKPFEHRQLQDVIHGLFPAPGGAVGARTS
ncbi:MAG TPA: response regulator [Opitutaceae bacterium]|nr:response regulator [Opitutaceae bacterium]